MGRLRYAGVVGTIGSGNLTSSATSHTFTAALTYGDALSPVTLPTLTGSDYFLLSVLDASGNLSEVVKVTAYDSGTKAATLARGQEGTTGVAHTSGDKVTMGAYASDFAGGATRIYKTSSQSLASATRKAIVFDNEDFDDLSCHDNSTNPTRMTVGATGRYRVTANAGVVLATTLLLEIRKNSDLNAGTPVLGTRIAVVLIPGASSEVIGQVDSGQVQLASGDWIEIGIIAFGSSTTVDSPGADSCWAYLERIS